MVGAFVETSGLGEVGTGAVGRATELVGTFGRVFGAGSVSARGWLPPAAWTAVPIVEAYGIGAVGTTCGALCSPAREISDT